MKLHAKVIVTAAFAAVALAPVPALSGSLDVASVPASMCEPTSPASADKLRLGSNGYYFRRANTGFATLHCPIPYKSADFVGGESVYMLNYRLFYRDTDGNGNAARVYTWFLERSINGTVSFSDLLDSNTYPDTGYSAQFRFMDTFLGLDQLHGLYVVMYRANTSQRPVFSGFDMNGTSF